MSDVIATEHQHIERVEGVQGGRPVVKGTRTPVKTIVGYYKLGLSVEEILEGLPHLTPAQVYDALSYYHDHQEEIERDIRESRIERVLKEQGLVMDKEGVITFDGKA